MTKSNLSKLVQIRSKIPQNQRWKLVKTFDYQREKAMKAGRSRRQKLRRSKKRRQRYQLLEPIVKLDLELRKIINFREIIRADQRGFNY